MVRIYYLAVIRRTEGKRSVLCECSDLSDFRFFRRKSAEEFMRFSSCVLAGRTEPGSKVSVQEQTYICHVFAMTEDLAAAAVTDEEYPHTAAHMCLTDLLRDFEKNSCPSNEQATISYDGIKDFMANYKTPRYIDRLSMVQGELDETKIILYQSLESVLRRGENLDDLVTRADELSIQSKTFYKTARKTNACCSSF